MRTVGFDKMLNVVLGRQQTRRNLVVLQLPYYAMEDANKSNNPDFMIKLWFSFQMVYTRIGGPQSGALQDYKPLYLECREVTLEDTGRCNKTVIHRCLYSLTRCTKKP